jgi:hypothetical protein
MSERRTGYEMLYGLAKRSGKNLGMNVVFNGSGFYFSPKEIYEAEKEHVDTLVTFSDEIGDLKNYGDSYGTLRHLLVWYRSGDQKKKQYLYQIGEKTPLMSRPQHCRLEDYTSIRRLHGVVKNQIMTMGIQDVPAFTDSIISEEIRRELLAYADFREVIGLDVAQGNI